MYGPVPTAPQRGRGARVWTLLVRAVLTAVPVLTIGMLSWIPMLWLAIVHRRVRDWLGFFSVAAVSIGGFVLIGTSPDDRSWHNGLGAVLMLGTMACVPAYFLVVELRPRPVDREVPVEATPVVPPPVHPGYPLPGLPRPDRIEQVRAGLDELSAYLEQQRHA